VTARPPLRGLPWLFIICFVLLAAAYGLLVPPFENLDEIEHFGAIRYVADTGRLPTHAIPEAETYYYRQEASQPPLYYIVSAGLVRLLGLRGDDFADFYRFNPRNACGPDAPNLYDNRAILYHNPNREAFPWRDTLLMLHTLRLWSTLLQTVTVATTFAIARLAFPRHRWAAPLATALVAFNPQFLLVASGVNNDNLVTPLSALGLYLLLRAWRDGLTLRRALGLGLLIGLAGLSKLSGWTLLGLAGLAALGLLLRAREGRRRIALLAALIPLTALLVAGWWFWRNLQLYGDLTALQPMLELVGRRGSPIYPLFELGLMFRSFWGQISCSFFPDGFYWLYIALTVLGLAGLAWGWRRLAAPERTMALFLGGWFGLILLSWVRWDMLTAAPGGRLLFPALPALAALLAVGLGSLGRHRVVVPLAVVMLALSAGWTAVRILPAFFAPPPRTSADAVHPSNPTNATFGDSIRLLGYDVALDGEQRTLDIGLFWQATSPIRDDYVLALQLVSAIPGDTTLRWNYNSWPGRGNYPTSAWLPDEVIVDRYHFLLPEADVATQAWDLQLALHVGEERERLPVFQDGIAAGDRLILTRQRVAGLSPSCPEEGRLSADVRFSDVIALTHAWIVPAPDGVNVHLCWQALGTMSTDYTVFVHLDEGAGAPLAAGDGPPLGGGFPTSLWQPGDVVLDTHHLPTAPVAGQRVTVGLYNFADGARLPATAAGQPVPDGAVAIWP